MNRSIFSNESAPQDYDSVVSKVFKTTAYTVVLIISLLGNTLLILGIKRNINDRMRTTSNLLIASVAVSDLIMTIWSFPERMTRTITNDKWLIPGVGGSILCKIVNFSEKLSITVSVLHLGALAVERFLAVFSPYKTVIKPRTVKYIIGSIWISSALYWSPILYYGKIRATDQKLRCEVRRFVEDWRSWYLAFIVILCGVMLAILVLYIALAINLCHRKDPATRLASQRKKSDHIKRRVVVMVGVIIVAFYVCFLPYWIGWVLCSYAATMPAQICNKTYKFTSILLSYASCMTNPIICFTFIGYFRLAFKAILMDPLNKNTHEVRLRLRRKSSVTEFDTIVPQSKKSIEGPRDTHQLLVYKRHSKENPIVQDHNGVSIINRDLHSSHEGHSNEPTKRGNVNTSKNNTPGNSNEEGNNQDKDLKKDDNASNEYGVKTNILTLYGTPV